MKKSLLLDIVCTLTLFAMSSSACAAIIAGDDTSITGADQSYDLTLAASPSSISGVALTLAKLGDSGQAEPDGDFNFVVDGASSESPHTDSHKSFWLLLMVASVFGILSEVYHRRSINR